MKKQEEEFRDIPGYEGLYQVSNLGRVKSLKFSEEKILNNNINSGGYYRVGLSKDRKLITKTVHVLVAVTFLGHTQNGTHEIVVDHINNVKTDNRADNLQLVTQRKNSSKDKNNGKSKYVGVTHHKISKKWMSQIRINGKNIYLGLFTCELEAHNTYQNKLKEIQNEG